MPLSDLLSHVKKLQKSGPKSWMCLCPSHDDRSRSMKITQSDNGKVLINCFAGCTPIEILDAVGLTIDDLFEEPLQHSSKGIKGHVYPREVLKAMIPELMITLISAFTLKKGEALNDVDHERLKVAYSRIMNAIELAEIE